MIEFKLPDIGEGIAEGEIVKWLVSSGDDVEEHQPIVEVMTDKATVEIPAPAAGTIAKLLAKEGETVPVGQVIFHLQENAGATASAPTEEAPTAASPEPQAAAPSGMGVLEFKLPDIGEGVAEGEVVKWLVSAGDQVQEHQPVVEIMTDKATVEVPAPASGKVTQLCAEAGQIVPVGNVLYHLETSAAPVLEPALSVAAVAGKPATVEMSSSIGGARVLAVPSARRVAREMGVDLSRVVGSGRNGVIRRSDVEAFTKEVPAPSGAPVASTPLPPERSEADQRVPFRGVRRKIAEAMSRSKFTATHFTIVEEVDVTDLVRLRQKAKELGAASGVKVTYMPFIMVAVAKGLMRYRMLNGHLDEAAEEILNPAYINLGIATDTPNGLMVPVIENVEAKQIMQLARELNDLAERTRDGKVRPEELRGSTFTITNAGNIGGTLATPIINFPDIAILGVHRIVKRPGVVETPEGDKIEVRQYMNLSCSVDHRLADGADAARFLAYLRTLLEEPGLLAL